jgi:hypothetical protein
VSLFVGRTGRACILYGGKGEGGHCLLVSLCCIRKLCSGRGRRPADASAICNEGRGRGEGGAAEEPTSPPEPGN